MTFQARQGDVFVLKVPGHRPAGVPIAAEGTDVVLAYGEITGHAHRLIAADAAETDDCDYPPAQVFEEPDGQRYLIVEASCVLTHEEHDSIAIDPGCYRVVIQRQYAPEGNSNVRD